MIDGARQLPVHHLTVRVPWHDNNWNGTFCQSPCGNTSCTVLKRVASGRDDLFESAHAGESIEGLAREQMPPCVDEHGTIMARFPQSMVKQHPYADWKRDSHGHFAATPYTIPSYSAATIPFRWMLREQVEGKDAGGGRMEELQLGYAAEREPDLGSANTWVQEGNNQRVLLDTFISAVRPDDSLVFFYAKRTPLAEDPRRVIVGVGRVKTVGGLTEYRYAGGSCPPGKISGFLWERNVEHSIRPGGTDGFLLPYQELIALAAADASIDLPACAAYAPQEYFEQFSYGSELLQQDGAIASLLALEKAIKAMRSLLDAPWDAYLQWIDRELNRLWTVRGPFPGMGAALNAFGLPHGNLMAWYLLADATESVDPWPLLSSALKNPARLPDYLQRGIGPTLHHKWEKLPPERRQLLELLARFNLTNAQALRWYQQTERSEAGIALSEKEILANPYLIFEEDRLQIDPVAFDVIDRGLFPPDVIRKRFPVPEPSFVPEAIDERRVRAVVIQTLEDAASEGHTLLPGDWLISRVRERPMKPGCPLDTDTLAVVGDALAPKVANVPLGEQGTAFQLDRYVATSSLISSTVLKRRNGKRNQGAEDWLALVNAAINNVNPASAVTADDLMARKEKAAALEEIYRSRVSVLMGPAGTGKSTLLKALCSIDSVTKAGILLLAPTGKARVRLERASGSVGKAQTVAQFLLGLQRYAADTGRYHINPEAPRSSAHRTVVIDECSMLTEEQFAALLDAIKGVDRLILVGDPRQLPPIGAGRPYVDIVQALKPQRVESLLPRVGPGYAELTVVMRQQGQEGTERADVLLANAFSGRALDAGADEVWNDVASGNSQFVKLVRWNQPDGLQKLLIDELVAELGLSTDDDELAFEVSLGGVASEYGGKTNVFFNNRYQGRSGASEKAEQWQILTPLRQGQAGVLALNRAIQQRFRKRFVEMASAGAYARVIPSPAGPEEIIYGDKVINVQNNKYRYVYPDKDDKYVANGDIGVVVGHRKTKSRSQIPRNVEVEFCSQPGFSYGYRLKEFDGQESSPPLELAYALTVHKTQGSEFGLTFVVVPNPCRLLSREMLYTALTRHKGKVVILHQGDFRDLRKFTFDQASEVLGRMTNLFATSDPVEVVSGNRSVFLDNNLIYRTDRGELVRSKSEWIIADKLHAAGVDYQYEQPLVLGGVERFPDFTIVDDDSGSTWYWEHNGMLSNSDYRQRWERKLAAYRKHGILPLAEGGGKNGTLLITEEKQGVGLNLQDINANIAAIRGC